MVTPDLLASIERQPMLEFPEIPSVDEELLQLSHLLLQIGNHRPLPSSQGQNAPRTTGVLRAPVRGYTERYGRLSRTRWEAWIVPGFAGGWRRVPTVQAAFLSWESDGPTPHRPIPREERP